MKTVSSRLSYFIAFGIILILLAIANYLQFYVGINPCPLCLLQRFTMGILGIIFLLGILFGLNRSARITLSLFGIIISIMGALFSGRQAWLQHLPKNFSANCDVSLNYMLQTLPLSEVVEKIFVGGTACAQVEWTLFYLSLAEWSFVCFILFGAFNLIQLIKK